MLVREVDDLLKVRFHFNAISNAIQCELQCKFRFVKLWGEFCLSPGFRVSFLFFLFVNSLLIQFRFCGSDWGLFNWMACKQPLQGGWFGFSFIVKEFVCGLVLISEQVVSCMRERASKAWRGVASLVRFIYFLFCK